MTRSVSVLCAAVVALAARGAAAEPGEVLLGAAGPEGAYVEALHSRGSARWEGNFLAMAAAKLPKDHSLNNPSLRVVLELSVARSGALAALKVKESSGLTAFDAAAMEVAKDTFPLMAPPDEGLSDDDHAHFTWAFARDDRRCDEVKLVRVESPIAEAIPRLLAAKRENEALRRVRAAAAPEAAMSVFARTWLKRALTEPSLAPAAAAALVAAGENADRSLVSKAVQEGTVTDTVAVAIARGKVPVCDLVKDRLSKTGTPEQAAAVAALRSAGEAACAPELTVVVHTASLPLAVRLGAVEALGSIADPAARKVVKDLTKDGPPAVRGAAIIASAPPGGGNAALFRLAPLLHDPALEVRVAAITGLLRAVGEPSLAQFYLLFNEKDPRPYEAAAAGLARLNSEASATLLARMLRKEDPRVRQAAAAALAHRSDSFARKALEPVSKDESPDVRVFASAVLDENDRHEAVAALGPRGADLYRKLVTGSGRAAAVDWLISAFSKAEPLTKVDALGAWIAGVPDADSVAITR
jgi:TonB family protein